MKEKLLALPPHERQSGEPYISIRKGPYVEADGTKVLLYIYEDYGIYTQTQFWYEV